jgi:hypothetical protein
MTKYLDADAERAGLRGYDLNLTSFNEVIEVLRSSKFVTVMDDRAGRHSPTIPRATTGRERAWMS